MLGPNHAMSGFGAGLGLSTLPDLAGFEIHPITQLVFASVMAGAALIPDWDHPTATISRAFGPVSWLVAKLLDQLSQNVYRDTKTTQDRVRKGGHRTLTHTAAFAIVVGVLIGLCSWWMGSNVVIGVLYVAVVLALRGLAGDWARRTGWIYTNAVALVIAIVAVSYGGNALVLGWWLGLAVTLGMITHDLGDAITNSGAPLLWPIRVAGQRWYRIGLPKSWQLTTGSRVERWIVSPVLLVFAIGAGLLAL